MRISVQRLRHIMALCGPIITRQSLPLQQFLLCQDGFAVANSDGMAIAVNLPELRDETFLLPHRTLGETIKFIPANTFLDITPEGGRITVKSVNGGFSTTLNQVDAQMFLPYPEFERTGGGQVDGDQLLQNLDELLAYTSTDSERPALTGICFTLGEELSLAAADGFRLAWRTLSLRLPAEEGQAPQVIIPSRTLRVLGQLWKTADLKPKPSTTLDPARLTANPQLQVASLAAGRRFLTIDFGDSKVSFNMGEATLISSIITEGFPNYEHLIPTKASHSVAFDSGTAYRAVRQLAPIARNSSGIIRLQWTKNQLTISAANDDIGESAVTLDASTKGRASRIAFNLKYLSELLAGKDGPMLLECNAPSQAGRFSHYASPNILLMSMFVAAPKDEATDGAEQGETTDGEHSGESWEDPSAEGNNGDSDDPREEEEDDEDAETTESTTE